MRAKDAKPPAGFRVQLYRGGKPSVVVGFDRNRDFSRVGSATRQFSRSDLAALRPSP